MPASAAPPRPHDIGLPDSLVRKRRHFRRIGYVMLLLAALTAIPGWFLYGLALWGAWAINPPPWPQTVVAYFLVITSTVTLVLGLWYLLLAQVRRLARVVEGDDSIPPRLCPGCQWPCDQSDRFCRHCGKPLFLK